MPGNCSTSITMEPSFTCDVGNMKGETSTKAIQGSVLSAHNINYKVKVKTKLWGPGTEKHILTDVTAVFKNGMTAIMGPTGCGKSSFLDILADRKGTAGITGNILLDGKRVPDNFKCMVGYVVQDDMIMGTLTVRENIHFSAALRLPKSVTGQERRKRVDSLIKELGLEKCADTKIGTDFLRGVSGGERKRCNIGMELIISPQVLFLDEPTTGLDADTAYTVLKFLKRVASRGRTIIFSIHQPRYSIFSLFDNLLLLSSGYVVYSGPAREALDFFSSQGYTCEVHNNPPDFFLDVISSYRKLKADNCDSDDSDKSKKDSQILECNLINGFKKSQWHTRVQHEASAIFSQFEAQSSRTDKGHEVKYATPFWKQIIVLSDRAVKNMIRDPETSMMTVGASLLFSLLITAIFWNISEDPISAFKDRTGVLFFLIINQLFFNMAAVDAFIKERKLFMHENISGFYRVSVYFLVKTVLDTIPMRTLPVLLISAIIYNATNLNPGFDHFVHLVVGLVCLTLAGAGICFFICSVIRVFAVAHMTLAVVYIIMMLLGGYMVNIASVGPWLNWLKYFSFFRYSQAALYINEFKDRTFCDSNGTFCDEGNSFLLSQKIEFREEWDYWKNHLALLGFALGYFLLSYIKLLSMKKMAV